MAKQTINIGASPNDGTGTPLRTSFDYTNQNFTEIYTALGGGVALPGATTQVIFNDGGTNLAGDAGLVYNKTTDALTVAGLVTAGSATISGDLTVDTSTLKVDSANNRVGILTASPAVALDVRGVINVNSGGSGGASQLLHTLAASSGGNYGQISNTGTNWALGYGASQSTVGTQSVIWDSSGNLSLASGNLVMSTAGKGIDFSATASGSGTMTSELLADYEEGTFTIGLEFGGASTGMTTNANTGKYTKIGRQVTVTGYLALTNKGSATGDALITGLPFLINSYGGLSIYLNAITFADFPMGYSNNGTSTIPLRECTNAGVTSSLTDSDFANNSEIIFTMTYNVA